MQILKSSALALMLGATSVVALTVAAPAQVSINFSVDVAPPPLPFYEQPPIPEEGYLWIPGYWSWDQADADYYWVPGTWVAAPQPGLLWTPGYWGWQNGHYAFYDGYWGPEVGFYGGVNYGYGYGGEGYQGGHWDHGSFFYNRDANNIGNVKITNVYEKTIIEDKSERRVSYNGGQGGISAKPTQKEESFAKEKHIEATPLQRKNAEAAVKNKALFAKENHGEPPIAATPRAGVFEGAGVSHGSRTPVAKTEPTKAGVAPKDQPAKADEMKKPEEAPAAAEAPKEAPKADAAHGAEPAKPAAKAEEMKKPEKAPTSAEAPKEAPKAESPKAEAPKAEAPRAAEAPKPVAKPEEMKRPDAESAPRAAEPPKREAPKAEAPRAEAPKAEAPRAEEKKP